MEVVKATFEFVRPLLQETGLQLLRRVYHNQYIRSGLNYFSKSICYFFLGNESSSCRQLYTPGKLPGEGPFMAVYRKFIEMTVNVSWAGYKYVFVPLTTFIFLATIGLRFWGLQISIEF